MSIYPIRIQICEKKTSILTLIGNDPMENEVWLRTNFSISSISRSRLLKKNLNYKIL